MHLLIVGTIAYSLFIITVRASQRHSCNMLAVGMVNYIVAATVYCVLSRGALLPLWLRLAWPEESSLPSASWCWYRPCGAEGCR